MRQGLDVVAVRVANEGRVVVRMVVSARAGRAIVDAPGGECSRVEGMHLRLAYSTESHMDALRMRHAFPNPEIAAWV